jgi:hypothetical protein
MNQNIYPLSYMICDEDIVLGNCEKKHVWAEVIPGFPETYRFGPNDEKEYRKMYKESRFAFTWKKGGWDCLRHYEILANGCIPVFRDLISCPTDTLNSYPKELIIRANNELIPWRDTEEYIKKYDYYQKKLLQHTRNYLTTSAGARYFLQVLNQNKIISSPKILFICCHEGVNYLREFLFIGCNRLCKKLGGECIMYPVLDFLYDYYSAEDLANKHGMGYGYGRRLQKTTEKELNSPSESEICNSIENHDWDYIVFAKVGPDEGANGSIPNLPYWNRVQEKYTKDEIVFLYGGDEAQDMRTDNVYSRHLKYHAQFGKCFVRELIN